MVTDSIAEKAFDAIPESCDKIVDEELKDEQSMSSMLIHRQLQAHNKNVKLIEDFKNKLSDIADTVIVEDEKISPVFIFIDELDRCRPDYAVRLLEVVKHIFNSKGICFLSSVNINQLQESIKTIYGLNFESDKYLDRFFSHRLKLPTPSVRDYIESLPLYLKIRDSKTRFAKNLAESDEKILIFYARVCHTHQFDLRTIKSLFYRLDICRKILKDENFEFNYDELIFIILCLIKSNKFEHESFEFAVNFSEYSINDFDYFLIKGNGQKSTLVTIRYGDLVKAINKIYSEHRSKERAKTFIVDKNYELYSLVLSTFGGSRGNEEDVIRKMHKYVEVCAMSGRLDE